MFGPETERFAWVVDEVERLLSNASVNLTDEARLPHFLVSSCWMETFLMYAKAMRTLLLDDLAAASGPVERALWELWIDWKYLFKVTAPSDAALKVQITAAVEVIEHVEKRAAEFSASSVTEARADIERWRAEAPALFEEVMAQRKKRRFHWSGFSRTELERQVMPAPGVYKALSWEAHSVMGPIRDLKITIEQGTARMEFGKRKDNVLIDPERLAYSTGGILFFTYADYAHAWGLPVLHLSSSA